MPTSTLSQTIKRPVADVFATVSDLTTFPQWNPTTVSAEKITDRPPDEGTKFELRIKGFGKQEIELTEFEENKRVRLSPQSKMFSGGHRFSFTDKGAVLR